MTPLGARLSRQIAATGPMRIADYMAACLTDPTHGYYTTQNPLGAAGDFTTAPEVSQMFGEMIGLWLAQTWTDAGRPDPFILAELGPGRGTLMADILRATSVVPEFASAARVWLVELSPTLRAVQAQAVPIARFADQVSDLPEGPLFVVANEFFDALPIRQFERTGPGWAERMVGLADGRLTVGLAPSVPDMDLDRRFPDAAEGTIVETCSQAEAVATTLAERDAHVLAIDYGDWDGTGDTFQAVRAHERSDPLAAPGEADLTAHVGFRWLAEAASGLVPAFTTQGLFLERLGITARAQALAPGDPTGIAGQHRRLTHPQEMGTLFKVLCLRPARSPLPPGFSP